MSYLTYFWLIRSEDRSRLLFFLIFVELLPTDSALPPNMHVVFRCLFYRKSVRRWAVQRERSSMRTSLRWKRQGRNLPIVLHSDLVQNDRLTQWWPVREVCTYTNKCVTVQNWWPWLHELNTEPQIKYESVGLARFKIQDLLLSLCERDFEESLGLKYSTHKWNIHAREI